MELESVDIKHVLYATDNSEDARFAFSYAASLAKQYSAKLTLLHVVQEFRDMVAFDFGVERSVAAQKWFSINKDFYQEIKNQMESMAEAKYDGGSINFEDIIVKEGNPVKMILRTAKERSCDLIVMGIKGGSSLEDAMMGGTVNAVLRRSPIPVMVVRRNRKK